jgi:hypothetical protein
MPAINQSKQPSTGGGTYQETTEQKEAWKKLRSYMRSLNLGVGDTFTVKGTIAKMLLDGGEDNPRYFTKKQVKDDGSEYDWPFVKVLAAITDPAFGKPGTLDFPAKNVGASFFDGVTKKGRSPNRGGMYNLHVAVTGAEPSQALKDGKGNWDTEDYENKPILLRLVYQGKEEEGSAYADRRLGMKLFIAGFEKDRDVHRASSDLDDDDDDAPFDTDPVIVAERNVERVRAQAEASKAADLSVTPATDRQVAFIYALGREVGLDKGQVAEWSVELFNNLPEVITRRDASALIDALQRKRLEDVAPSDDDKDELVSVGVSRKPAAPPEDDDDLSF